MQINNNTSSPNFGMALKIKSSAMESLKKAPMETLESLEKIGADLKDTKYYHLEIGENLAPKITSPYANKYASYFEVKKPERLYPDLLPYRTEWAGTELNGMKIGERYDGIINYSSKEAALEAYNKINSANSELEKAALLTKELDNREIQKQAARNQERLIDKAKEEKATELLNKFGFDE